MNDEMINITEEELIEELAKLEHERWSDWMEHLFKQSDFSMSVILTAIETGSAVIPKRWVDRWAHQMNTPYKDLSETEKKADRREARKTLRVLKEKNLLKIG